MNQENALHNVRMSYTELRAWLNSRVGEDGFVDGLVLSGCNFFGPPAGEAWITHVTIPVVFNFLGFELTLKTIKLELLAGHLLKNSSITGCYFGQ